MTVWVLFYCFMFDCNEEKRQLSHLVNSFADTGYLSCSVVLVINALACSHLDNLGSRSELSLCGLLVTRFYYCEHLLDCGLHTGSDCLISVSFYASYRNSLLCGFDISQSRIPPLNIESELLLDDV